MIPLGVVCGFNIFQGWHLCWCQWCHYPPSWIVWTGLNDQQGIVFKCVLMASAERQRITWINCRGEKLSECAPNAAWISEAIAKDDDPQWSTRIFLQVKQAAMDMHRSFSTPILIHMRMPWLPPSLYYQGWWVLISQVFFRWETCDVLRWHKPKVSSTRRCPHWMVVESVEVSPVVWYALNVGTRLGTGFGTLYRRNSCQPRTQVITVHLSRTYRRHCWFGWLVVWGPSPHGEVWLKVAPGPPQ